MVATIDHLLYGCADLDAGIEEVQRLTGVRAAYGGRHEGRGTHNALLALGPRTYLEIIAPDPGQADLESKLPYGLGQLIEPSLRAWAAAPEHIDEAVRHGRAAGIGFGDVSTHQRSAPGGGAVRWRMSTRSPEDGGIEVVPFLIDWGSGSHPADTAPGGVRLEHLRAVTPDAADISEKFRAIGVDLQVDQADKPALEATLRTRGGTLVVLRS